MTMETSVKVTAHFESSIRVMMVKYCVKINMLLKRLFSKPITTTRKIPLNQTPFLNISHYFRIKESKTQSNKCIFDQTLFNKYRAGQIFNRNTTTDAIFLMSKGIILIGNYHQTHFSLIFLAVFHIL